MMTPELERARREIQARDERMRDTGWRVAWDGEKLHVRQGVTERDVDAIIDRLCAFRDQVLKAQAHTVVLCGGDGRVLFEGHRDRKAKHNTAVHADKIEEHKP